jgi:hypothetical protein
MTEAASKKSNNRQTDSLIKSPQHDTVYKIKAAPPKTPTTPTSTAVHWTPAMVASAPLEPPPLEPEPWVEPEAGAEGVEVGANPARHLAALSSSSEVVDGAPVLIVALLLNEQARENHDPSSEYAVASAMRRTISSAVLFLEPRRQDIVELGNRVAD